MPALPPRTPFPIVATLAPVVVSLGIWAVTGSPYSLLFAALGPVVALGSMLDARRQRRRTTHREIERASAALAQVRLRVLELQESERGRLAAIAPALDDLLMPGRVLRWMPATDGTGPLPVRLGLAERPSAVVLDPAGGAIGPDDDFPAAVGAAVRELQDCAQALPDAPWLVDAREGIAVVGPVVEARAVARCILLQLAARCSPTTTRIVVQANEVWARSLPHVVEFTSDPGYRLVTGDAELLIAWVADISAVPPGIGAAVELGAAVPAAAHPDALGSARAAMAATTLAELADERGLLPAGRRLPDAVRLSEVLSGVPTSGLDGSDRPGLRAPIGHDENGAVELDLVRDGPHAVVAGTTGAGKSELLVSWVLAMAARHPPSAVTFLLVDFKGGAAFAPLADLPHVLGIVSDLDARRSARAIESLRAELLRRERTLAEHGARSIDELGPGSGLARLVIVVDEFAAVVSGQPELHELFADLAARGRSLGLHLILCTQRPSGVVRDAVLANITLRISLRVIDRGDSLAMLGSDAAARLAPEPKGRALIADGTVVRELQLALAEGGDADRLVPRGERPSGPVWLDPLPEQLALEGVIAAAGAASGADDSGVPFGLVDLPAEQRQPVARLDPGDGHLLVVGGARSGRTTVLATLAQSARLRGVAVRLVPPDPAEAWSLLTALAGSPGIEEAPRSVEPGLLLLDDLDVLLDRVDPDTRHELLELLCRYVRGARIQSLVVTTQRLTGGLQTLAGLFDARILLRQTSRDEHVLAGGDGATFDPRQPAGSGRWTGRRGAGSVIQVAQGSDPLPRAELVELPIVRWDAAPLAVVHPRPRQLVAAWTQADARIVVLGEHPTPTEDELRIPSTRPLILLGDPDAWQAEWATLGVVRRELPLVMVGCTAAELRSLARIRDAAPLLGSRPGECWLVEGGAVRRAILHGP